ncbi:lactoylglutathione lyase [Dolosicoccus paucivorans]|uniref:Aldoketomutase n=1 Tax=Dolosicoccus paucivorans TaxID=84521 RepID=A0A2N6SLN0_9LACT|nr:VOC family protein [Dolosicoccus paucivorans]PMB83840.1 lactoylglutathione lyase [Dolosicoccus paucivorans]PMC57984.1 lactoylglutathione lyase [Dolosicoccus paucivorans]
MAQTLLHACLRVQDLDASKKFYTEVFDFEVSRERDFPEHDFTLSYLVVPGSDFELELTYNYDHGPYEIGDGFSHLALGVDDLEAVHQKCLDSGYETTELKGLPGHDPSYFFVSDPDGYRLEVMRNK